MGGVRKRFDQPDETREFPNGIVAGVELAGSAAAKATFQPGWRWSESVKPIVGGESCQQHHVGYALSGTPQRRHHGRRNWRSPREMRTRSSQGTTPGSWETSRSRDLSSTIAP